MNKIIPRKLNIGDEIRVIAPSRSMCILNDDVIETAEKEIELVTGDRKRLHVT